MKEIITINIGQPGIQIGDQVLQLYARQHSLILQNTRTQKENTQMHIQTKFNPVFFEENKQGTFTHRAICVDFDPLVTDSLKNGGHRQFYNPANILCSLSQSGGNYSRGFDISKKQLTPAFQQAFRKIMETCDYFQGVIVNNSLQGGTSGFFANMAQKVFGEAVISKKPLISNLLFPSNKMSNSIVQIYNFVLSFKQILQYFDLAITFDNQSLYQMCQHQLGIQNPFYSQVNELAAQMQSAVTLSMRSNGPLNSTLDSLVTNLVCYPRILMVYPSFSSSAFFNQNGGATVQSLTNKIFLPQSKMLKLYDIQNKISVSLSYRGYVEPFEVRESMKKLKSQQNLNCIFQQWSPTGFKVGINHQVPIKMKTNYPYSSNQINQINCCSLTSSMQYNAVLSNLNLKFDKLYAKRAFVHWFCASLPQHQFSQAREDLAALQKDYQIWSPHYQYQQEEA